MSDNLSTDTPRLAKRMNFQTRFCREDIHRFSTLSPVVVVHLRKGSWSFLINNTCLHTIMVSFLWLISPTTEVFWGDQGQVYAKENRIDKTLPNPRRKQTFHEVGSSLIALCVLNRTPQLRIGDEETEHLLLPHCWSMPWFSSATAPSFRRFIVGGSSPEEHPCAKWSNGAQEEMLCCGHLLLKPQRKLYQFYCTTWRNTKRALLLCDKLHICLIRHRKLAHIRNVQMNVQNVLAS